VVRGEGSRFYLLPKKNAPGAEREPISHTDKSRDAINTQGKSVGGKSRKLGFRFDQFLMQTPKKTKQPDLF